MPLLTLLLGWHLGAAVPVQETPHLEIATIRHFADRDGGGRIGMWRKLMVGERIEETVHNFEKGCGFIFSTPGAKPEVPDQAVIGWRFVATPVELSADHVLLQIEWSREVENGTRLEASPQRAMLRLRPGDVATLDSALLPKCQNSLATFVIALKGEEPGVTRVAATDLWLVHRQPDGKEATQHVLLRAPFDERTLLVFDTVRIGGTTFDVSGRITPRTGSEGVALHVDAGFRGRTAGSDWVYMGHGSCVVRLAPADVTSIELPLRRPEYEGHSLSIRVRSRRIR